MKKLLLKSMLLLFALIVGSSSVWATTGTLTLSSSTKFGTTSGSTLNDDQGNTWTCVGSNIQNSYQSTYSGQQFGTGSTNNTFTFTANFSGKTVTSVSITAAAGNTTPTYDISVGGTSKKSGSLSKTSTTYSTGTISGTGNIVITLNQNSSKKAVYLGSIVVTYTTSGGGSEPETVSTPSFDPNGSSTYTTSQSVEISCLTADATIYYTMTINGTDPADPTVDDNLYTNAISVTKSGTKIKAKAFKDGMTASAVASATYTIKPGKPTVSATGATVTITADDGCDIYYTTNNSVPSKSSTHYTGPFKLNADCSIKAIAYDAADNSSDIRQYNYVYLPLEPKNINSNYFVKVTDVSTLENGDAILIVCESDNVALSTDQKSYNRGQKSVTITNNTIDSPSADVQKLVLMIKENFFYFHTGSGYLYAASSSSNYLKTEMTPDENNNAKAQITISTGDATIKFQGSNERNWLKHNSSSSLFSCYAPEDENQHIVQIYKEIPKEPAEPSTDDVAHTVTLTTTANMAGWRTFAPVKDDQNYTVDGTTKVYYASATADSKVTLTEITGGVPANTPVILHQTSGTTITLTETATSITAPGSNLLQVSTAGQNLGTVYRLGFKSANGVGFYTYTTNSAPAGIIYLSSINAAREFLGFDFDDNETTGIGATLVNSEKMNSEVFDLQGRKVVQPTKGLYIVNGKKVVIK